MVAGDIFCVERSLTTGGQYGHRQQNQITSFEGWLDTRATCHKTLPAHRPFLVPIYEAYIALGDYDVEKADAIIKKGLETYADNSSYLFETAQYYARRCHYHEALKFYELSWKADEDKKPRYTDPLEGMAIIYEILGDYEMAVKTYDRMIKCIKEEWGYKTEDAATTHAQRKKERAEAKIKR